MKDATYYLLRSLGVKFVRFVSSGNANIIRGKAVATESLRDYWDKGVGFTAALQAMPIMYDSVIDATGLGPVGEVRLVADWDTLRPLPYAPGHARVFGDFLVDGEPWKHCVRTFLKRVLADAASEGLVFRAGFEYEFTLFDDRETLHPVDDTIFAATLASDISASFVEDVADALAEQGIWVDQHYAESAPGQHELSVKPSDPLSTADSHLCVRETVRAVAREHGWIASFLPKIIAGAAGNGCHLNLSIDKDGEPLLADPSRPHSLSADGAAFMAGILEHLPAIMAITIPSGNSYHRIQPHFWSGAYRSWGVDNREAALRLPSGPVGVGPDHVELKTNDATANPYLALGVVIAAGLDGLRRGARLAEPEQGDPGNLSDEQRAERGIDALPTDLPDALDRLEQDSLLTAALGPELMRSYVATKRVEWEALSGLSVEAQVNMLLERY